MKTAAYFQFYFINLNMPHMNGGNAGIHQENGISEKRSGIYLFHFIGPGLKNSFCNKFDSVVISFN
jgi:hypothetical protein